MQVAFDLQAGHRKCLLEGMKLRPHSAHRLTSSTVEAPYDAETGHRPWRRRSSSGLSEVGPRPDAASRARSGFERTLISSAAIGSAARQVSTRRGGLAAAD